jgi:DMSO reductase anchor subunit/ferredoxin
MDGCPSSVYTRDPLSGAVLFEREKCIGCKYCQWNCPYDAPKYDSITRTIAKCNLCYTSLIEGRSPACTSACPTGALTFGALSETAGDVPYAWFPDTKLKPAIEFTSNQTSALQIIPEVERRKSVQGIQPKSISQDISLVIFSFLSVLSVATLISAFIDGAFSTIIISVTLLFLAGVVSLFHLGQKSRSWRALSNMKKSHLSREIVAFIVYFTLSVATAVFRLPLLVIISSVTGLVFLILIDSVYIYSDKSRSIVMHSGQTFISALLIASFLSGLTLPFIFLGAVKLISPCNNLFRKQDDKYFIFRFLRLAFLILSALAMITKNSHLEFLTVFIFLAGELFDRILFYVDFKPLNINILISEHHNADKNEKERS